MLLEVDLLTFSSQMGTPSSHDVLVLVGGDLVRVDLSDSVGDGVSNGMTNKAVTNAVANNTMANCVADSMANHTMANSNAVSHRVSHKRGSHGVGGDSMSYSSNNAMAKSSDSVGDGVGWGWCSNSGGSSNPGGGHSNSAETSAEDLGGGGGGGHKGREIEEGLQRERVSVFCICI